MAKQSAASKNDYTANNYDRISCFCPKGKKDEWAAAAKKAGYKGLNGLMIAATEFFVNGTSDEWVTAAKLKEMPLADFVKLCVEKEIARMKGKEEGGV